jgi:hypothetical protein
MCTDPQLADWYCWPSNEHNADAAPGIVSEWTEALAAAQDRARSRERFLLGFSNGGYFAGLIGAHHLLEAAAIVIAHAGPPAEPLAPSARLPPLLLLSADDDIAQDEMIRFDEQLTLGGWAHDSYARAGAHGLTDEDIDAALAFFSRAKEPLPLDPPLPLHRAVRRDLDAGQDVDASIEASLSDAEPRKLARPDAKTQEPASRAIEPHEPPSRAIEPPEPASPEADALAN